MNNIYRFLIISLFTLCSSLGFGQAYNTGYPIITEYTGTTATAVTNYTEDPIYTPPPPSPTTTYYYTHYIVLPSTVQAPTSSDVVLWSYDNTLPSGHFGFIEITSANTPLEGAITNLDEGTDYSAYFVTTYNFSSIQDATPIRVDFPPITTPLTIQSYSPGQDATNVGLNDNLLLTFSEPIERGSGFIRIFDANGELETINATNNTRISLDGSQMTIDLAATLAYGTSYYILIDDGFVSATATGASFAGITDISEWTFTTEAAPSPLTITGFNPAQGSTDVDPNASIVLTFSETSMWPNGGDVSIYESGAGTPTLTMNVDNSPYISFTNTQLVINPPQGTLSTGTTYEVAIDPDAVASADAPDAVFAGLARGVYSFMTGSNSLDFTSVTPIDNSTGVRTDQTLQITFSENIEFTGSTDGEIAIYNINDPGNAYYTFNISGSTGTNGASISNNILSLDPEVNLPSSSDLYVIITNDMIQSTTGLVFAGFNENTDWNFQTGLETPLYFPATNSADIPLDTELTITFSETIERGTGYLTIYDSNGDDLETIPATSTNRLTFSDNTIVIIDPNLNLAENTTYYILIDQGFIISNSIPYAGISDPFEWRFSTYNPPPITTIIPNDGAEDVSVKPEIIVNFDQPVQHLDGMEITDANATDLISFTQGTSDIAFTATINTNKTQIIIIPDNDLSSNTTYTVVIEPVENHDGLQQTQSTSSTFTTGNFIYWVGGDSFAPSDMSISDNWDPGLPTETGVSFSAIIPVVTNMPVLSSGNMTLQSLVIEPGASLEINSTHILTIEDLLELKSSNDETIGNASLINNGTLTVAGSDVVIHQSITSPTSPYFISSPVQNATSVSIGCDYGMASYDNTTDSYVWWVPGQSAITLTPGIGYQLYSYNDDIRFSGSINNASSYQIPLLRTPNQGLGWNLVGNPYPAAIDWDAIEDILKVDIVNAFWIYRNDLRNYGTYSPVGGGANLPDGQIPSNHSFWLKVLEGDYTGGSITLSKDDLIANSKTFLKSSKANENPRIKLAGVNGTYNDETVIAFSEYSKDLQDSYDAEKKFISSNNFLQLYSVETFNSLAINCKVSIEEYTNLEVKLGFRAPHSGTFEINAVELKNLPAGTQVLLEDKLEGTIVALSENFSYSFTVNRSGTNNNRFVLHIQNSTATGIEKSGNNEDISIYGHSNTISITGNGIRNKKFEIYTLDGKLLKKGTIVDEYKTDISMTPCGLVIVRLYSEKDVITKKVLLK